MARRTACSLAAFPAQGSRPPPGFGSRLALPPVPRHPPTPPPPTPRLPTTPRPLHPSSPTSPGCLQPTLVPLLTPLESQLSLPCLRPSVRCWLLPALLGGGANASSHPGPHPWPPAGSSAGWEPSDTHALALAPSCWELGSTELDRLRQIGKLRPLRCSPFCLGLNAIPGETQGH